MKKGLIIVLACLIAIVGVGTVVHYSSQKSRNEAMNNNFVEYQEGLSEEDLELKEAIEDAQNEYNEHTEIFDLMEQDEAMNIEIKSNVDETYDYYVCLYVRSALREYCDSIEDYSVYFDVSKEPILIDGNIDMLSISVKGDNGVRLNIVIDRLAETWSWEVE